MASFTLRINDLLAMEAWNTTTTPVVKLAAPTGLSGVAMTGSNGLSWNARANASGYRLQRAPVTNSTATSYGNVYEGTNTSYTDTTATAGQVYDYRIKALGTGNYSDSDYASPAVRVTSAPSNNLADYTIPNEAYADSPFSQDITLGGVSGKLHGTLSGAKGTTSATVIKVGMRGNVNTLGSQFSAATLGVFVNEVYQRIDFQSTANEDLQPVLNLPAGTKTIRFVNTDLARAGSGTTNVVGSFIARIQANAGFTWQPPTAPAKRYLVLTDSIGSGNNAPDKAVDAWTALLRADVGAGNGVAVDGYSGGSFDDIYGPNAPRPESLARILAGLDGTVENILVPALGTNDGLLNTNGAAGRFGDNLTALIQDVRAQRPDVKFIINTPIPTANNDGQLEGVRQQQRTVAQALGVTLIEGPSLVSVSDLDNDGIHLTKAGQNKYFVNWRQATGGGPGAATGAGAFIDEFDAASPDTTRWDLAYFDTAKPNVSITQVAGQLVLRAATGSGNQSGLTTKVARDMSGGRSLSCKVPSIAAAADSLFILAICPSALKQADRAVGLAIVNGRLIAQGLNFTELANIAYDPIAHAYLRLVEYSGHQVSQYSADNQTWFTLYDNGNVGFALTAVFLAVGGGSASVGSNPGTMSGFNADWVRFSIDVAISPPTPVPYPQQFGNSDFSQPLGTDQTVEFVGAVYDAANGYVLGGNAYTSNGKLIVNNSDWAVQVVQLVQNGIYDLVGVLSSIGGTGAGAAQIIGNAGEGQINEAKMGAGTGRTPGTYTRTFTSTFTGPAFFIPNVTGAPVDAAWDSITITRRS